MLAGRDEQEREAIKQWLKTIAESPGSDYLAGAATIGELDEAKLERVAMSAMARGQTLQLLM